MKSKQACLDGTAMRNLPLHGDFANDRHILDGWLRARPQDRTKVVYLDCKVEEVDEWEARPTGMGTQTLGGSSA